MNWSDERYVRLYTRDSTSWLLWSWQAQALFTLLLRKADRTGAIDLGSHGKKGICAHLKMPWDVAGPALDELLEDGCLAYLEGTSSRLVFRNYVAAQEAVASPSLRQKAWRDRRREEPALRDVDARNGHRASALRGVDETSRRDETSTGRDEASTGANEALRNVDAADSPVTPVTPSRAVPIRSVPDQPEDPERARARVPSAPPRARTSRPRETGRGEPDPGYPDPTTIGRLAEHEARLVAQGREIPWRHDARRWGMTHDVHGFPVEPMGPPNGKGHA